MPRKSATEKPIVVSSGAAAAAAPTRRKSVTSKRTPRTTEPAAGLAAVAEPTQEAIAQLAYSYWVERGYQAGSPEEDWLRAEQELRAAK